MELNKKLLDEAIKLNVIAAINEDIKQNDKFTKVIVTSFLLIFVYYFFTNLMNTLGSNSKLPPFLSTLITPLLLFTISIAFNKYKTFNRKYESH